MAEKKDGFGLTTTETGKSRTIFETPHYAVILAKLSNGSPTEPEELRIRFLVVSKQYPVICGHSGLEGEAIGLALSAEAMLLTAHEVAEEAKARNYQAPQGRGSTGFGAPNLG